MRLLLALAVAILAWDANTEPDLAGYRIYHGAQPGGPYTVVATLGTVTTWTHTGLASGVHCYRATAYSATDESGYSNEACARVSDVRRQVVKLRLRGRIGE